MEAYLGLIQPRPPGNIHAGQSLVFGPGLLRVGDQITISVSCKEKTEIKGRGWVTFECLVTNGAATLLRGDIRSIWAK
jgi:acyl dehydratase